MPSVYLAVTGQTITANQHNVPLLDIQAALSQAMLRSGVSPMGATLNMGGHKISSLMAGTDDADAVRLSQLNDAISGLGADHIVTNKAGSYTATDSDFNAVFQFTAAATLTLPLSADLRDYWFVTVWAQGGDVTITSNVLDTINATTSLIVRTGQKAFIYRMGATTFVAMIVDDSSYGYSATGRLDGLSLSRAGAFNIGISQGSAGSDGAIAQLMVLASDFTKRMDSGWAVGSGNGGLDVGTIADGTYYVYVIKRVDTGVTDVLFSLQPTSPTMPDGYSLKRRIGTIYRSGGFTMPLANEPQGIWTQDFGELNMPVGVSLAVQDATPANRGVIMPVYLKTGNSAAYTANASLSGGTMLGTYRNLGLINANTCMAQRVSYG